MPKLSRQMRQMKRFLVVVEMEVEATSVEKAKAAAMRGIDHGITDVGEIESAQITEVT